MQENDVTYKMGWKDEMGYNHEIHEVLPKLVEVGYGQYIINHNPTDYYEWAHTRTIGVDLEMQISSYKLCIEISYCSKQYYYRREWFTKCRVPRFRDCPKPDSHTYWIILTNMPENFNPVQEIAAEYSISIMGLNQLISLIAKLQSNINNNNLSNIISNNQLTIINKQLVNQLINNQSLIKL